MSFLPLTVPEAEAEKLLRAKVVTLVMAEHDAAVDNQSNEKEDSDMEAP